MEYFKTFNSYKNELILSSNKKKITINEDEQFGEGSSYGAMEIPFILLAMHLKLDLLIHLHCPRRKPKIILLVIIQMVMSADRKVVNGKK